MRLILIGIIGSLVLTGCARTPEEAAAYRQFGMQMLGASAAQSQASSYSPLPCVFNPGSNAYQQCFHFTAGGQCAHYGGVCQP